jgi:acetyl esterase/lipase
MRRWRAVALALAAAAHATVSLGIGPREVEALPATPPSLVSRYGEGAMQFGELRLPAGKGPFPVAIVVHGGCWTKGLATLRSTAPIASALAEKGIATWNIEYRQVGDAGGGWPGTFLDWGSAADHLRELARSSPLDLGRVATIGHSAGGHAALWLASRSRLPAESEIRGAEPLAVHAAVSLDGPGDLVAFVGEDAEFCGRPVVEPLVGGNPADRPERYREASPRALLPLGLPQFLIATRLLSREDADAYRLAAQALGDRVEILSPIGAGHYGIIAPGTKGWREVEAWLLERLFARPNAGS